MPDLAYDYAHETAWLHEYLEQTGGKVFYTADGLADMQRWRMGGSQILFLIKTNRVVWGEPDPAGAELVVEGEIADGWPMCITLRVDVNALRVEVVGVDRA